MDITFQQVVFWVLAVIISVFSVMTVVSSRILRSATYLIFVLFGTAGLYFLLNYSFLGAVQLMIYAGGIVVLYVFSILLTSSESRKPDKLLKKKMFAALVASLAGLGLCLFVTLKHTFLPSRFQEGELPVKEIGHALLGMDKYQFLLPFEAISILLLACIIGGILIARKR
ncbi:MAG: NADH-quinone oxidoreductase subunit J [Bacteroidales bacterium]|nr:NADH-quinone oxidoreductase subunit J [Bacteroidales bacterium]